MLLDRNTTGAVLNAARLMADRQFASDVEA